MFVIYKLQQLKAERGRCHLAKDSSQNFPQRSFGSLHEGQKQLRPLRTTLDEGALQWQRRHLQSGFSHPRQYFLGRLRTCGPAQPAEGCKSHFEMTIPQGFSHDRLTGVMPSPFGMKQPSRFGFGFAALRSDSHLPVASRSRALILLYTITC